MFDDTQLWDFVMSLDHFYDSIGCLLATVGSEEELCSLFIENAQNNQLTFN